MEDDRRRPSRPPPPNNIKGHVVSGETSSAQSLIKVKQCHDEAYLYIQQALTCDESGQKEHAVTLYSKGLRCIDFANDINLTNCCESDRQKAEKLLKKLAVNKEEVQNRVEVLISTDAGVAMSIADPPPSYEEATTPTMSDFDMLLDASLDSLGDGVDEGAAAATELFKIDDGVQIFYITKEGYVSAPSYPSSLGVYKFRDEVSSRHGDQNVGVAQVFLRVSDWTYPLISGHSPVLQANWGAYIFPDVTSSGDGNSVGVIIPDFVNPAQRAKFENILSSYTALRNQELSPSEEERRITEARTLPPDVSSAEPPQRLGDERTSQKISRGLETAAEWISWGLVKGAEKTGELMKKGSTKLQHSLKPEDEPSKIDPRTQKGVYYTRKATEGVVKVSGYLVMKLGQGTMLLARKAAPHLRKTGEKYLPASFTAKSDDGHSKMDDVATVAVGGLKGWATVYVGLEQAAKSLAKNITNETVDVVRHKYGTDAGKVTKDVMHSGVNVAFTVHNATCLGATAIAKRAAKDAGQAVIEDAGKDADKTKEVVDKSTELR